MLRFIAFLAIAMVSVSAKELKQAPEAEAKFVGAIGCRSSSCHGGAGEKRSQYITWSQKDFHARAYAILLDARSARIGEAVGTSQPQSNARCTVCHSPFQSIPPTRLISTAHPDEGVSCESCHGAAEPWLRGHTRSDWTYATRVNAGMHDLRNLYVRANSCVACHQNVAADILKAGHPELVFEFDSQSVNEPKHWRDDDPAIGPCSWLIGQAVALRETAWHARADNDASDDTRETSLALAWLLMKVTSADPELPKISEPKFSDLELLQKEADEVARSAAAWRPTNDSMMSILRTLAASDSEFGIIKQTRGEQLFYRAKRVVLALDRVTTALNANRLETVKAGNELTALREDVRLRDNFDAKRFAEHLRAFHAKL